VKNPKRNFQKLLPKLVVGKIPSWPDNEIPIWCA
jgi:hypothetical protein